jgi:hypothetical protein
MTDATHSQHFVYRRRRQTAPTQAAIARAGRVAQALGPNWRLLIKGEVVELFQSEAPMTQTTAAPVAPDKRWRL